MPEALDENTRRLAPLAARRPTSVPEVVDLLGEIRDVADDLEGEGRRDGIACFSDLYHTITKSVLEEYEKGGLFHSGEFILELDIAFAQRYLDALHLWLTTGAEAPACWAILFDRRQRRARQWRFAVVGVNAHVNFDLAFALLDVWEDHPDVPIDPSDRDLSAGAAQRRDYLAVNSIFHQHMDSLCEDHDTPWTRWPEFLEDGGLVDTIANLGGDLVVERTRDVAWEKAVELWDHRAYEDYRDLRRASEKELDDTAERIADFLI